MQKWVLSLEATAAMTDIHKPLTTIEVYNNDQNVTLSCYDTSCGIILTLTTHLNITEDQVHPVQYTTVLIF